MRKNTRASGWRVLASKYCVITGEAPAVGSGKVEGAWAFMGGSDATGRGESRQPPQPLELDANRPKLWMDSLFLVELQKFELRDLPRRALRRRGDGARPRDVVARDLSGPPGRRLPGADERAGLRATLPPHPDRARRERHPGRRRPLRPGGLRPGRRLPARRSRRGGD